MGLSLANMLTIVKRYIPTTTMDTELTAAILERMNFLVSADVFPFQEVYKTIDLAAGNWRLEVPSNFATIKDLIIYQADYERPLEFYSSVEFDSRFPNPSNLDAAEPSIYTIKIAESEIWLNCPTDIVYTFRILFYQIPADVTDQTVSQLTELARLTISKWSIADGLRMNQEHDRADKMEAQGDKFFAILQRRYQLSREIDSAFISPKKFHSMYKGH